MGIMKVDATCKMKNEKNSLAVSYKRSSMKHALI